MADSALNAESPPLRSTILSFFPRGRPRGASHSNPSPDPPDSSSNPLPILPPSPGHRRRNAAPSPNPSTAITPTASSVPTSLGLSHMLRRRRSAGNIPTTVPTPTSPAPINTLPSTTMPPNPDSALPTTDSPASHRIRFVPHIESRRSLRFDPIVRTVKAGDPPLRIGRFTDRSGGNSLSAVAASQGKLAFKSKVVSRAHAEIWVDHEGRFFIKDTKSSSGTFLNHVRLSNAGIESRQQQIKDGDILQLGVDYQGGTEDIYKSVKMRVEIGRDWQRSANAFNTAALKNLKSLATTVQTTKSEGGLPVKANRSTSIPDCCICLFPVAIRQALFLAPCSHTFHYKCIRPMLIEQHPAFSCPLCRTFADLEEDVEVDDSSMLLGNGIDEEDEHEEVAALAAVAEHIQAHDPPPPMAVHDPEPVVVAGAETEVEGDQAVPRPRVIPPTEERSSEEDMDFEDDALLAEGLIHVDRESVDEDEVPRSSASRVNGAVSPLPMDEDKKD